MMALTLDELCHDEWITQGNPEIRLRFRRDGSGSYNRSDAGKVTVEKLMFKLEDHLDIKLARARSWVDVEATIRPGKAAAGERFGQRELVLGRDPYVVAIEDKQSGELVLLSDAGASLPSQ
jgi:hypothetical protein